MSAIELLCEIIATGGRCRVADFRDDARFALLLKHGYLVDAGVIGSIAIDEDETPFDAEVVVSGGEYGYFSPVSGFSPLPRSEIRAASPDLARLVGGLGEAFELQRQKSSPVHGETWRVGVLQTEQGTLSVYLHPRLRDQSDAFEVTDALSREVRSDWRLIISTSGEMPVGKAPIVDLRELVELHGETGALAPVMQIRSVVGMPTRRTVGAPNRHGAALLSLIRSRDQNGTSLDGMNEEAKALIVECQRARPHERAPSIATVKRYLKEHRDGS